MTSNDISPQISLQIILKANTTFSSSTYLLAYLLNYFSQKPFKSSWWFNIFWLNKEFYCNYFKVKTCSLGFLRAEAFWRPSYLLLLLLLLLRCWLLWFIILQNSKVNSNLYLGQELRKNSQNSLFLNRFT